MSLHAISKVKSARFGGVTKKAIMLVLADYADESGYCYPSIERIAAEAETSPRTVQRQISELVSAGFLQRSIRSGRRHTNIYRISFSTFSSIDYPDFTNDDILTPILKQGETLGEKVTNPTLKGDKSDTKRCHPCHPNRQRTVREPSVLKKGSPKNETAQSDQVLNPNQNQNQKAGGKEEALPHGPAFAGAWNLWETHRAEIGKKLTPSTKSMQLNKLKKLTEKHAIETINQSVEGGYTGLFPDSLNLNHNEKTRSNLSRTGQNRSGQPGSRNAAANSALAEEMPKIR